MSTRVSRWRRWQWSRDAKRQLTEELTVIVEWPGVKNPQTMKVRLGNSVTVVDAFTLVMTGNRQVRITPPMDDKQLSDEHEAGIRARYGMH